MSRYRMALYPIDAILYLAEQYENMKPYVKKMPKPKGFWASLFG